MDELSQASLVKTLGSTMDELESIWEKLGLSEEEMSRRRKSALGNVSSLLSEMLAEEKGRLESVQLNVQQSRLELETLQVELNSFIVNIDEDMPLIMAADSYRRALDELKIEKKRRISLWKDLNEQLTLICGRIGEEHKYDSREESVPSLLELESLEEDVKFKMSILRQRTKLFEGYGEKIRNFASVLNYCGRNAFEISVLNTGESPPVLSDHDIDLLSAFYTELHEKYEEHMEKLQKECDEKYGALVQAWDQCKISINERQHFLGQIKGTLVISRFLVDEGPFKILIRSKLNNCTKQKSIVSTVTTKSVSKSWKWYWSGRRSGWQSWIWRFSLIKACRCTKFFRCQNREADPKRYSNRGGVLLKEEREKRAIERKLLKVRQCIEGAAAAWNELHPSDPILVDGLPVMKKLETTEIRYEQEKEEEKHARKFLRKAKLEDECVYSSGSHHVNKVLKTPSGPKSTIKTPGTVYQTPKNRQGMPQIVIRSPSCSCLPDTASVNGLPPILPSASSLEEIGTQPSSYGQFVVDLHCLSGNQVSSFVCDASFEEDE
ncbi:hypothetical protein D918_09174 [Trichuris suis]|nr:hypothetical protein D918_09174 [Trichuris suis]